MSDVEPNNLHSAIEGLRNVRDRIARAEKDAGRKIGTTTLIAVSKTFSDKFITPVLDAGERTFGENRVQEAKAKWPSLKAKYPGTRLHLIGPLQSNKVRDAVDLFDVIETIDRPKIAVAIAAETDRTGKTPKLYVEINTGTEPQKAGISPEAADDFIRFMRRDLGLAIEGLMCIPPEEALKAPHFSLLAKIAERNGISRLSMGMSADFEIAIQCGATDVRVGSAIFGHRIAATG